MHHILQICTFILLSGCTHISSSQAASTDDSGRTVSEVMIDSTMTETSSTEIQEYKETLPIGVKALMEAYPSFIKGYKSGEVVFTDSATMIYDDGRHKDFQTLLDESDLEDMFYRCYVQPGQGQVPEYLADAGRFRNEALFKKMYGQSSNEVRKNLVSVNWFGQTIQFSSVNGAAEQLKKVAEELSLHPELAKYLKSSGSFNWRPVRGAKRMSAHSYGIAFDIGVEYSDYWKWKNPKASETDSIRYYNRFPHEIVNIFRKHGFIWGGSWYHFDTMHFEYRPEILIYTRMTEEL